MRLYFFTGTGNSYWAAKYIASLAADESIDSKVIAIDKLPASQVPPGSSGSLTGFVFPTHGFSLPWYMLKFFLRYPRGKGRVFLVNNRAGMKMGKLFTPGISGIAVHLPLIILLLKGYSVAGTMPLDTPSNWISVHPGLKLKVIDSIFRRREKDLRRLWEGISSGKRFFPLKYILAIPLDIALVPVSVMYMLFGRLILARSYFSDENCDGCTICAERCPVGAISMKKGKPYWSYRCESCMRCSNICPKKSVNSSVPIMIMVSWVIIKISSYTGPLRPFWLWLDGMTGRADWIVNYFVLWIFTLVLCFLIYNIIFLLARLPGISLLISRTTPSHWWRHYMAPGFRGRYKEPGR